MLLFYLASGLVLCRANAAPMSSLDQSMWPSMVVRGLLLFAEGIIVVIVVCSIDLCYERTKSDTLEVCVCGGGSRRKETRFDSTLNEITDRFKETGCHLFLIGFLHTFEKTYSDQLRLYRKTRRSNNSSSAILAEHCLLVIYRPGRFGVKKWHVTPLNTKNTTFVFNSSLFLLGDRWRDSQK
jgi:hypothetical protein